MAIALIVLVALAAVPAVLVVDAYLMARRLDQLARKIQQERQHAA